jgi:hypothetical protein
MGTYISPVPATSVFINGTLTVPEITYKPKATTSWSKPTPSTLSVAIDALAQRQQGKYVTIFGKACVAGVRDTGQGNMLYYSPDGSSWQAVSSPLTGGCSAVAWNGKMWLAGIFNVATTGSHVICRSYDGITWLPSANTFPYLSTDVGAGNTVYSIVWDYFNGIWITLISSSIWISSDGITWTIRSTNNGITNITIGPSAEGAGTMLVGASYYSSAGQYTALRYSLDQGLTWTVCPTQPSRGTATNGITTLSTNGKVWVCSLTYIDNNGGGYDQVWYSMDGINWVASPSSQTMIPTNAINPTQGDTRFVTSFCWNGTVWVCSIQRGAMFYSYDGITWTICITPAYYSVQSITFNGTKFIALFGNYAGATHQYANSDSAPPASSQMESLDGITWTLKSGISGSINVYYATSQTALPFINPVNAVVPYIPATPANWASPVPTSFSEAINRLAAAVAGLLTTAIP